MAVDDVKSRVGTNQISSNVDAVHAKRSTFVKIAEDRVPIDLVSQSEVRDFSCLVSREDKGAVNKTSDKQRKVRSRTIEALNLLVD